MYNILNKIEKNSISGKQVMRPEVMYHCVKTYIGKTKKGYPIHFAKGDAYFSTARGSTVYLNHYDHTPRSLPSMSLDEFKHLAHDYLERED